MKTVRSLKQMQFLSAAWKRRGRTVGFVPTMGAFHEGHVSLMRRARRENQIVVVSLFVNPAQFGPAEDLARYPRRWAHDRHVAQKAGADVLFSPSATEMYPAGFQTWITVEELSRPLCGPFRPGHFRAVATVVAKLFQLVQPTRAYFGRKDFQQLRIVEQVVRDLNFPVKVVALPTVRGADGVAISSRLAYLTPAQRKAAGGIRRALQAAAEVIKFHSSAPSTEAVRAAKRILRAVPGARLDYVSVVDPVTLRPLTRVKGKALVAAAVRLGRARLIDNILVTTE